MDTPIQFMKGVGPKFGDLLGSKGIRTVQDLLEWYPRAYEDRRAARSVASLRPDELVSLKAQILKVSSYKMGRSTRKIYDITVGDETGRIHCKYFRVPYKGYFERFEPLQWIRVVGKVTHYRGQTEFHHPDLQDLKAEMAEDDVLVPIYPETEGLSTRQLQKMIRSALEQLGQAQKLAGGLGGKSTTAPRSKFLPPQAKTEFAKIPKSIEEKYGLMSRMAALEFLHVPPKDAGQDLLELKSPAHRRIIFEEFFWLEMILAARRSGLKREHARPMQKKLELIQSLQKNLPFELTDAQKKTFKEIANDLIQPHPMYRLVQGDVGSGKTLVAFMASLLAFANQRQTALMAPTEILAEQHYKNAKRLLEPLGLTVGYLTGSMKAADRKATFQLLQNGMIHLVIGTHALIEDDVEFHDLGLVIIDEQHRFGVHQRAKLKKKGYSPHFLVMTATPIPRTLAMTVYGDLDVSVINEMPPGRSPIQTRVTYDSSRAKVHTFMEEHLQRGRQAYIVYPLVEESEKMDLKDAVSQFELLRTQMPNIKFGLLHGKMKAQEKDAIMLEFREGRIQVLVSTTVIEVGVDVPNANMMIIEHAERFGLSQLHQLRGRVGRGEHKSFCVLILGHAVSDDSRQRAKIMEDTNDGFKIAEADLEIRGPGEFLGTRQSGLPGFKLANLVRDVAILQEAREAAFELVERDPELAHQVAKSRELNF